MSCFIVSRECIHRAVSLWMSDENGQHVFGVDYSGEQADDLGRRMMRLNTEAFSYRYAHKDDVEPVGTDEEEGFDAYRYRLQYVPRIDGLKALKCVIYQCSEGEQFEKSTLYKDMRKMELATLQAIVTALPEYDAAEWG